MRITRWLCAFIRIVFIDPHRDLTVGKAAEMHLTQVDPEVARDLLGQSSIRRAGQQFETVARYGKAVHFGTRC